MPHLTDGQAAQLRAFLATTHEHGIALPDSGETTPTDDGAGRLIVATLNYARALHSGRLPVASFQTDWGLRPSPYDPWLGFVAAVQADRLPVWFNTLPPPFAGYQNLERALVRYRILEDRGGWQVLAEGPDPAGAAGDRALALRKRLAIEDPEAQIDAEGHEQDVAAIQRAQRRYGLEPTGVVDKATLAALDVSVHDRVRQIEANMERWRWLPAELPPHRVQVNIAAAVLTVFDAEKPTTSMHVVTGRPGDETPMLSSQIHSVVFNPPWNVPSSIATRELWPKEHAHPGYLKAHGFKVIGEGAGARLQQAAGPRSALGKVKFDFDNPYGVYLHDTPSQGTFDRYNRLASHGCVRLAHPVELAKLALRDAPDWTSDDVDAALHKGDTVRARLTTPIAVLLLYWTAYASGDGRVTFLGDPYGWDRSLANRLQPNVVLAHQIAGVR